MKTSIKFSFIAFVFVIAVMTVPQRARSEDGGTEDPAKVIIEVDKLGTELGVPEEEATMPDGKVLMSQKWGAAEIQKAVAELPKRYHDPDKTYMVTSSPHPAITLAFIQALQPLDVGYLYMAPGGDEVPMCELKKMPEIPEADANLGVRFEIIEDGDKLFMNFNSDSPEATAAKSHSFNIGDTCKIAIPEIPKGKHLYLHARGRYCVMVALAFNYIKDTKSISIARHEDDYTCAISFSDVIEVGEVTKRTLPNEL
jgi:hypothetical protein